MSLLGTAQTSNFFMNKITEVSHLPLIPLSHGLPRMEHGWNTDFGSWTKEIRENQCQSVALERKMTFPLMGKRSMEVEQL